MGSMATESSLRPRYRYRFGSVEFDESRFELRVAGLTVDVQRKPLDVLKYLLDHAGSIVTKEELLESLWSGMAPVDNVVGNAIAKLRAALGEENAKRIVTQPRIGYRLTGVVERHPIDRRPESASMLESGQRVPRRENFRLESVIAHTGANEVWLARHEHTRELRVYKFALRGDDHAQLKREVTLFRILSENLNDRDAFVTIIDWNLESPPYFLEYEFGGECLIHWAAAGHLSRTTESQRLEIFRRLVDAVASAHSVGVLHKDIKPGNILIAPENGGWKVRLTDFGVGGLVDKERLLHLGISGISLSAADSVKPSSVSGTQPYIAPEILRGQAATAQCDVFALGVILYQLLCGDLQKGLSPGWERDVGDALLREDIAAATDGDPALRIASAVELSDRIRRLEQRRTQRIASDAAAQKAVRDAAAVRLSRARRPWLVATFAALCAGLCAALLLSKRVFDAEQAQSRQFAVAQALNNFLTSNFIAVANPTETGRKDVTVVEAARSAASNIDTVFRNADPQIRGGLHASMQNAFAGLSDVGASVTEGQKALEALSAAQPADARQLALVRVGLAAMLAQSTRLDEAAAQLTAVQDLMRKDRLTDNIVAVQYLWARARLESFRMTLKDALEDYRRAWELAKGDSSLPPELRDQLQFSYADALKMTSHFAEAHAEATELLARQRARLGPQHPQPCYTSLLVASVAGYTNGNVDAALSTANQAAACLSQKLGPANIRTATAYRVLADLQFQSGHYADAAQDYEKLATSFASIVGADTLQTINARMNTAVAEQFAGHLVDAEAALSATLDSARTSLGWSAPTTQALRYHLADCRLDQRHTKEVIQLLDGLSAKTLNAAQIQEDWDGRLLYESGRLALLSRQYDKAIPALQQAAEIIAVKNPDGHISEASIRRLIAEAGQQHHAAGPFQ
jgi:eukaryotic-like serine/threonine-protein kinase